MIYEYPQGKREKIIPLFEEHNFLEAIVLGLVASNLGKVYVDSLKTPENAMLIFKSTSSVIAFGGSGVGEDAKKMVSEIPNKSGFFCPNDNWKALINERFGDKIKLKPRTKFSSASLDRAYIRKLKIMIPDGYEIVKINDTLIDLFEEKTKQKFIRFVGSLDYFKQNGFGFCVLYEDRIVGDATNGGLLYKNAFEMDIEIHQDHRRRGLATTLAAHLIDYSLENNYDPRWDAANQASVELAQKLGYTNPEKHELMVYWDD